MDPHDQDYQQWREEQLRALDKDYQTWRQDRYRKFSDEFNAWRASRRSGGSSDSLCHSDLILEMKVKTKGGEQIALLHITST